jgi:ribosomal protein L12E/L44/L45/RPP1/RPP2
MKTASRTLVKSPPEVWEQLDHPGRMQGLMSALVGHAAEVEVYERVEESKLAWKADDARIEVRIAEKGWGTNVSVSAENGKQPTKLEGWLDAVLDELATPTKRPFGGMTEAPAETVPALSAIQQAEPSKEEQADEEEQAEEEPAEEPAAAEQSPPEPVEPPRKKKFFRFLGF